jgi:hypothetical protein
MGMMKSQCRVLSFVVVFCAVCCAGLSAQAFEGFIGLTNGYFYDQVTGETFVPHGVAYQTWNRPLGVWQTYDQIDYDLDEMVKMGANSVRIDMVWQHIEGDGATSVEEGDNNFAWEKWEYFVQACEERDLRIFALVGYQWPPNWFPDEWYTKHPPSKDSEGIMHTNRWASDIINYEHPEARAQYNEWIYSVANHFKDSKAIVGWIVGNESGYLGLWSGLLDGYDPESEQAFRVWCEEKYGTIEACNAAWGGTEFASFDDIKFVETYRAYGKEGAQWADMVQWREDSIAVFTAIGAAGAAIGDTNHLISYSTVGMQWGEEDWRYHAEDRGKITAVCARSNAPIDFFSVNNYPWSILGHESQQGHWGISYTKKTAGVPVLYSETGFTSSETMWPGMNEYREGPLVRNALWESLEAGANGTHVFSWMDRPYITDREKGFGIVYADRRIKPAFWDCREAYNLMDQVKIDDLLMGSEDAKPDVAFLWTAANDSQYNRYECEMQQIAGALERLGYEPWFMDLQDLADGAYTNYKAVFLPRNMRVEEEVPGTGKTMLDFLREDVIGAGVHVVAGANLPGRQNPTAQRRPEFEQEVAELFGIDATDVGGYEWPARWGDYVSGYWHPLDITFTSNAVGAVTNGYNYMPQVWRYSDEVKPTNGGVVWAWMDSQRNKGFEDDDSAFVKWDGAWGDGLVVPNVPDLAYDGSNMALLSGNAGIYKNFPVVPFARCTASAFLKRQGEWSGEEARVTIEWYDQQWNLLGISSAQAVTASTPGGDDWVEYRVDDLAPADVYTGRRVIRLDANGANNVAALLNNGDLSGSGDAPDQWYGWSAENSDPQTGTALSAPNSWQFWWDSGLFQDVTSGFVPGDIIHFGGSFYNPASDALTADKHGQVEVEFYNGDTLISGSIAAPAVTADSETNTWLTSERVLVVPDNTTKIRVLVRCTGSGDGRFYVDDVFLTRNRGVLVDNHALSPAMVVKDHGTAKAAIFMYTVGDISPDGNMDDEMDVLPWKWRFDIFGSLMKDYFNAPSDIDITGDNAHLCLAEYRTCTNGATLWQVKNYMYDRFQVASPEDPIGGGDPQTFTISSPLFTGKNIQGFYAAEVLEENSDGTLDITLVPDGMEMLYVYDSEPGPDDDYIIQIHDAPALVHPFGDKAYQVTIQYDCRTRTDLVAKIAFEEADDNGDGTSNEVYQMLATNALGSGAQFWLWIPDPDTGDPDYISTPDGGNYIVTAWLEDTNGTRVAEAVPQPVMLTWGVRPTSPMPTNIVKGQHIEIPIEWEALYEYLTWEVTPMQRNASFPNRIAIFRSSKTEAAFPGHFDRVNELCDWLGTKGYSTGNDLDISFDNIRVNGSLIDDFSDGSADDWQRAAGCANWTVEDGALRASRIGNDDNIFALPGQSWSDYTASVDLRYNAQGPYFNDAEFYIRYQDRNNYVKVGIRNFYAFWRLKYTVRVETNFIDYGWIHEFSKTNRPVEGAWYNLEIQAQGTNYTVRFDGEEVDAFSSPAFSSGGIAVGSKAQQLGIWEPQKGYYFIDDDEYSYYSPVEGEIVTLGTPLDLDWGYLNTFYPTLVLPGTYIMSDIEVTNVTRWLDKGMRCLLATDGGVAMLNETGQPAPGRMEYLFGAGTGVTNLGSAGSFTVTSNEHYITHEYEIGDSLPILGPVVSWTDLTTGTALGRMGGETQLPAFIVNVRTNNPVAPSKIFCFNFAVDRLGQMTNRFDLLSERAFGWAQGQAYKVKLELKYCKDVDDNSLDIALREVEGWLLTGSGEQTLVIDIPETDIMTGTNLYWDMYVYPWNAEDPWLGHGGMYSAINDTANQFVSMCGTGLQVLGMTAEAFGGRSWDMWAAYNTDGEDIQAVFGLQDGGMFLAQDAFNDGDYNDWTILPDPTVSWNVSPSGTLQAVSTPTGSARIRKDSLDVRNRNITIKYDVLFEDGAQEGGFEYRGLMLHVSPSGCGWDDTFPCYYPGTLLTEGQWHEVTVSIRESDDGLISDLYIDDEPVFFNEPLEYNAWDGESIGLVSPSGSGTLQWDNLRVSDELYSWAGQNVSGVFVPTNENQATFYPWAPDYDPAFKEYAGFSEDGTNQWYIYFKGDEMNSRIPVNIYFSPRLRTEDPAFPTNITAGTSVDVPVSWEHLDDLTPAVLSLVLQDAATGCKVLQQEFDILTTNGNQTFTVNVPDASVDSEDYLWMAFIYPTNAADPWIGRIGSDDTYRTGPDEIPIEPETPVTVHSPNNTFTVFADRGMPVGCEGYTWGPLAQFYGHYADPEAPEGSECWLTAIYGSYSGWGVFYRNRVVDLSAYNAIKFWVKAFSANVKIEVETREPTTKRTVWLRDTNWDTNQPNAWQEVTIPIAHFGFSAPLTNVYSPFEVTGLSTDGSTFFSIDNVRWVSDESVTALNRAPVVHAGSDQNVLISLGVNLNGSVSDDNLPEGSTLALQWQQVSGPGTVTFSTPNAEDTHADFTAQGYYTLRLTADDSAAQTFDEVVIYAKTNDAPVIDAGSDLTAQPGQWISLAAGNITDDGLPERKLMIEWSKLSGPGDVTISNYLRSVIQVGMPGMNVSTHDAAASFSTTGTYVLILEANDYTVTGMPDTITVNVSADNQAPVVSAGPDRSILIGQNLSLSGIVTDDGLPQDAEITTWWLKTDGPDGVTIADQSGTETTARFSTTGTYILRLYANDTQLTGHDDVTVQVRPIPARPEIDFRGTDVSPDQISITISTEQGLKYTIEYTDGSLTPTTQWQTFSNTSNGIGTWTETRPGQSAFTFTDTQDANTTGQPAPNGRRCYRIKVQYAD